MNRFTLRTGFSPVRTSRAALAIAAVIALSGCESLPPALRDALPGTTSKESPSPRTPTTTSRPAPATAGDARDLRQIVELLQDGRLQQGRSGLVRLLEREPGNATARSLLRQIDTDPVALLGREHSLYTVQPGDTLSELAARHLGDPVNFLALARYNGIERPRALQAGQTLRIPTAARGAQPMSPPSQPTPAALPPPSPTPEPPRADEAPAPATANAARVTEYHEAAVVHFRNQRLDEAIALWDQVLALDPEFEPARGYRTRALELKRRLEELPARN